MKHQYEQEHQNSCQQELKTQKRLTCKMLIKKFFSAKEKKIGINEVLCIQV